MLLSHNRQTSNRRFEVLPGLPAPQIVGSSTQWPTTWSLLKPTRCQSGLELQACRFKAICQLKRGKLCLLITFEHLKSHKLKMLTLTMCQTGDCSNITSHRDEITSGGQEK